MINEIEKFVCNMYGHAKTKKVDDVRGAMLRKMVGTSKLNSNKVYLARLPSCRRSLIPHISRVNYRVAQWKLSHVAFPELPSPTSHGWTMDYETSILEPVWSEGPILPESLAELVTTDISVDKNEQCDFVQEDLSSDEDKEDY